MGSRFAAVVLSILLGAASSVASAATPTAAEKEAARRMMDEGKARMKANEPARAVESFAKAHEIMHVPTTGMALAKAYLAAGHLVEARDVALEIGRIPKEAGDPAVFESARKHAKELDSQLRPRIPTLRIKIKNGPAAKVAIDDAEVAATILDAPIPVNPGKRVVSAKNSEGADARGEVELAERETKEIELILPEATGKKPETKPEPKAETKPAQVEEPKPRTTTPPPKEERSQLAEGLMYGGIGVGALGVAIGGVTGALTLSAAGDVTPQCQNNICDPAARDSLDSASTLATVSTISFIVAGVGIAAAVIGYSLPKEKQRKYAWLRGTF